MRNSIKEYVKFLYRLYDITWFGAVCANIYSLYICNLIFTTKYMDSSILITIISWDYLNLSLMNEYVGDVTIPTQVIIYNQYYSRQISQSDYSIHIKLNYWEINISYFYIIQVKTLTGGWQIRSVKSMRELRDNCCRFSVINVAAQLKNDSNFSGSALLGTCLRLFPS